MPLVVWDQEFEVGIEIIDDQHRHLVELLNATHGLIVVTEAREAITSVVNMLLDYATYHFGTEESLMREHGYPLLADHQREHNAFIARALGFERELVNRNGLPTLKVACFLNDWLIQHILRVDAGTAAFLVTRMR